MPSDFIVPNNDGNTAIATNTGDISFTTAEAGLFGDDNAGNIATSTNSGST